MKLKITEEAANKIKNQAIICHPKACRGVLLGSPKEREVKDIRPADDGGVLKMREGEEVIGFYHAHVNASSQPEDEDLHETSPEYSYVIISIMKGKIAEMRSWRPSKQGFREERLVIEKE